ncbi:hypothetical protein CL618_00210 [archaeon]|nr:hypothetical protein [archaeon]|tara:strand:- start:4390 stop:5016 length:627 start_codon:yes stop_codon:yes gene_type:complete
MVLINELAELAILGVGAGTFVNWGSIPFVSVVTPCIPPRFWISQGQADEYSDLPEDFDSREYAILANKIVYDNPNVLDKGDNCRDVSLHTLRLYKSLAMVNQRGDLLNKIRLAMGLMSDLNGAGHVWLETRTEDDWELFDANWYPTQDATVESIPKIMEYCITPDPSRITLGRSLPGTMLMYPTAQAFYLPGGMFTLAKNTYNYLNSK